MTVGGGPVYFPRPTAGALPASPMGLGRGVYVHVPFCLVRCGYCDFNAYAGMDALAGPYVDALVREIEAAADGGPVATVFVGGGTPTQLPPASLGRILAAVRDAFALDPGAEVTVEANPETVDEGVFAALRAAGFNRVSVGVQSLAPEVLRRLDRVHSAERALGALRAARSAGFERLNGDLIFGTPGETDDDWRRSLDGVLGAGVDHVSAYALTVEPSTPLASAVARGILVGPDEDAQADRYETAARVLAEAGLVRYEISNWAVPGSWCRHNLVYWTGGDYFGFGAGAHGHHAGRRAWNLRLPRTYVERSPAVEDGFEELGPSQRREEAAILGLRLAGGLDRAAFARRWGADPADFWGAELEGLREAGLVEVTAGAVRPAGPGFLLNGEIARRLLTVPGAA
ncbi:MAG: radical SAM family heme chaperone HemW [Actinomycetota bacterium]